MNKHIIRKRGTFRRTTSLFLEASASSSPFASCLSPLASPFFLSLSKTLTRRSPGRPPWTKTGEARPPWETSTQPATFFFRFGVSASRFFDSCPKKKAWESLAAVDSEHQARRPPACWSTRSFSGTPSPKKNLPNEETRRCPLLNSAISLSGCPAFKPPAPSHRSAGRGLVSGWHSRNAPLRGWRVRPTRRRVWAAG